MNRVSSFRRLGSSMATPRRRPWSATGSSGRGVRSLARISIWPPRAIARHRPLQALQASLGVSRRLQGAFGPIGPPGSPGRARDSTRVQRHVATPEAPPRPVQGSGTCRGGGATACDLPMAALTVCENPHLQASVRCATYSHAGSTRPPELWSECCSVTGTGDTIFTHPRIQFLAAQCFLFCCLHLIGTAQAASVAVSPPPHPAPPPAAVPSVTSRPRF